MTIGNEVMASLRAKRREPKPTIAVYQSPIVRENRYVRFPTPTERDLDRAYPRWSGEWGYKVKRVTNSLEPHPGIAVDRAFLEDLIQQGWTVTVLSK